MKCKFQASVESGSTHEFEFVHEFQYYREIESTHEFEFSIVLKADILSVFFY